MTNRSTPPAIGSRAPLTREAVLDAALRLVDKGGVEALSMRKLGRDLGVEAMSLYNHIPNKAALLDGLVEQVMAQVEPRPPRERWEEDVRDLAHGYRRLALEHPRVVPLIVMRPFNTLAALDPLERGLAVFRRAGFDDAAALHGLRTVMSFVSGYTLAETGGFFGEHRPPDTPSVIAVDDLDQARFPNLIELLPTIAGCDHDAEFEFALDVMIEGLRTKLR
ncbi:MAG: TetR/AcrR family transcriptional regulator C-terminal domain-containing protein [Actinomycetota bacterium]|nr:TetR/AcrR family transcriptional regulator C-terminal domain-containing protein [Actinomycetota bacterium]